VDHLIFHDMKTIVQMYHPENEKEYQEILHKMRTLPKQRVIDEIDQQLEEIYSIRHPRQVGKYTEYDMEAFKKTYYKKSKERFGVWVYYPWNGYFVHFLPEDMHQEIRTARNRNLITEEEQRKFYTATVAIAGLSVGNSAMATILHTGGGKRFHLADHDTLSASNLNRIRAGFTKLGLKKVEVAAQEIYEVNPFAQVELFRDGISEDVIDSFLLHPKKVGILIEEMDNIYLKIHIRFAARKHRIPVIMAADNGDNIVLDVERFDLEPDRPLFHGDIPEEELKSVTPLLSKSEAASIIVRMVHPENVAPKMKLSLLELGKTLYTWPQLGTAAFLAGCALSYTARKILVGEAISSGKYIISLDKSISQQ
jgi:molybdopterin/thiamine biosynthesis adenylyltransferase